MNLDKSWNRNTSSEIQNIYVEIIKCLKYSNTREDAMYEIQDLGLKNPYDWAQWADEQWNYENNRKMD